MFLAISFIRLLSSSKIDCLSKSYNLSIFEYSIFPIRVIRYFLSSFLINSLSNNESKFLEVMKNELMPYIESNYRTKARENTLSGYSLSGLFAFYTFLNEPGLFKNYIIGSPYLAVDNFKILDVQEEVFDKTEDIDARIFISVGSEESDEKYFNPIDEMVTRIEDKGYKSLKMETKVFDGGTHLLCPPEVLSYGLVSVFGK